MHSVYIEIIELLFMIVSFQRDSNRLIASMDLNLSLCICAPFSDVCKPSYEVESIYSLFKLELAL